MTSDSSDTRQTRDRYAGSLVPLLAFGTTLAGMALNSAGLVFEIRYAAIGGFLASCLLAYLAWTRLHRDIVALSTPIYGFLFLVTPMDYDGGIVIQLVYACGLTLLTARLYHRFGSGSPARSPGTGLTGGPLADYADSAGKSLSGLGPEAGHSAATVFLRFSAGEYGDAAVLSQAASRTQGMPPAVARAFGIVCQHAELLDRGLPRPETFRAFLNDDAGLLAKPLPGSGDPDRAFETELDNALLLLFSAGWHASPADRPALRASRGFAENLLAA